MATVADKPIIVLGDTCCDSPGHDATCGTYTVLDDCIPPDRCPGDSESYRGENSYWLEPEGLTE